MMSGAETHFGFNDDFMFNPRNRFMKSGSDLNPVVNDDGSEIFFPYFIPVLVFNFLCVYGYMESGLGISILPELILKRIPYKIITKELDVPAYRNIGLALKSKKNASLAVKRFTEYLKYRT